MPLLILACAFVVFFLHGTARIHSAHFNTSPIFIRGNNLVLQTGSAKGNPYIFSTAVGLCDRTPLKAVAPLLS